MLATSKRIGSPNETAVQRGGRRTIGGFGSGLPPSSHTTRTCSGTPSSVFRVARYRTSSNLVSMAIPGDPRFVRLQRFACTTFARSLGYMTIIFHQPSAGCPGAPPFVRLWRRVAEHQRQIPGFFFARDDNFVLTAPAGAAAAHAAVAASVARHDGAADLTAGSVAHVNQVLQRVGGVDKAVVSCQLAGVS